jgi:pilus assembly protein CpaB
MVFGLAIAAGSVLFAKERFFDATAAEADASMALVDVVVARTDINFGQAIEAHLVTTQPWPRAALPSGAFTEFARVVPDDRDNLRRAKGRFFAGEVILASKVSAFGDKVTLVQKLGENTRAMAIKVDAVTAVGGFVTPGDYVDIVMTQGRSQDMSAVTILQNIRVIGVDQQSEELKDQPEVARTITVEVTPDEGQRLALAQKAGSLSLTLRTLEGVEDKPMDMVRLKDLLQSESPVPTSEKSPTVIVRRGTTEEEVAVK